MALSTVGVLARGARLCVGILVALAYSAAWADVDQAFLEKAENLLKAGKAEDAYQMLEAVEVQAAGDLVYDYLLGTAALQTNRPSKATFVYERILAVAPSYIGVRADMGRAYFALGDYGRAKIEFETVLTFQNLPLDLRTSVEQYAKAADAYAQKRRTVGNGYIELGYGRDNNITGANEALTLNYPGTPPTIVAGAYSPGRKSDNYYALGLGGEVNHQMTDRWGSYIGADYRGRAYENFCDNTCNWSLDARGGMSYSGGAWLIKTGLTGGTYELNKKTYRDSLGLAVDWRMALTSGNQLSANISSTRTSYLDTTTVSQNTQTNTLSLGWLTSIGDGSTIVSLSASAGGEVAVGGRDDGNRDFYGPRLFVQKTFSPQWGAYVSAGLTSSKYAGTNPYYAVKRDETLADVTLGLTWSLGKGLSLRPQISSIKNTSNAELYAYEKTDASVHVRMDF
jgi:tetratricopeptide (TPR) repeat protein